MHEAVMAVDKLVWELEEAKRTIAGFEERAALVQEKAVNALRKEMEKSLIESDIKREVAIARLEAYERAVNKDDFNKEIREMLKLAISGLSSKPVSFQQKGGGQQIGSEQK